MPCVNVKWSGILTIRHTTRFHFPVLHNKLLCPEYCGREKDISYLAQVTGSFYFLHCPVVKELKWKGTQPGATQTSTREGKLLTYHLTSLSFLLFCSWYFTNTTNILGILASSLALINIRDSYFSSSVLFLGHQAFYLLITFP